MPENPIWLNWADSLPRQWQLWLESPLVKSAPVGLDYLYQQLSEKADWILTRLWPTNNLTLVHGDFHAQNIFWDGYKREAVFFDWDGCHPGRGAHDLAYLLALLPTDYRRQIESKLLEIYLEALHQADINYAETELKQDYQFGVLFASCLVPMMLQFVSPVDEIPGSTAYITQNVLTAAQDLKVIELL